MCNPVIRRVWLVITHPSSDRAWFTRAAIDRDRKNRKKNKIRFAAIYPSFGRASRRRFPTIYANCAPTRSLKHWSICLSPASTRRHALIHQFSVARAKNFECAKKMSERNKIKIERICYTARVVKVVEVNELRFLLTYSLVFFI